jgi:hypothetical protein
MTDPYAVLLELTEREHALVTSGAVAELAALQAQRAELVAALPARPPAAAAPLLRRASALQAQTAGLLGGALHELERDLERLGRGRTAVRGYAGAAPAGRLDVAG